MNVCCNCALGVGIPAALQPLYSVWEVRPPRLQLEAVAAQTHALKFVEHELYRKCYMYYDHFICMYYDHITFMYYHHNTRM